MTHRRVSSLCSLFRSEQEPHEHAISLFSDANPDSVIWSGPPPEIFTAQSLLYTSLVTSLFAAFLTIIENRWVNRCLSPELRRFCRPQVPGQTAGTGRIQEVALPPRDREPVDDGSAHIWIVIRTVPCRHNTYLDHIVCFLDPRSNTLLQLPLPFTLAHPHPKIPNPYLHRFWFAAIIFCILSFPQGPWAGSQASMVLVSRRAGEFRWYSSCGGRLGACTARHYCSATYTGLRRHPHRLGGAGQMHIVFLGFIFFTPKFADPDQTCVLYAGRFVGASFSVVEQAPTQPSVNGQAKSDWREAGDVGASPTNLLLSLELVFAS